MDDLLREFLHETDELLEVLLADLQTLRARRGEGSARRDLIGRIFRHIHTIKGSASALDLEVTTKLAHEIESLLDEARLGRIAPDDAFIEALEDGAAAIAASVGAARRGVAAVVPDTLIERIQRIAARENMPAPLGAAEAVLDLLPDDVGRSLSQYERVRLRESIEEGASLFIINVNFALETFDERFRELSAELTDHGDLVSTMPGVDPAALDQISFRLVYCAKASANELSHRLEQYAELTIVELSRAATPAPAAPAVEADADGADPTRLSLVRVDMRELDDLVAATHELATDAGVALDLALAGEMPRAERTDLELRVARIRRRFVAMEERLIELRMVGLDQTLSRVLRAGTTAARSTGKEVEFAKLGGEVQIDKSLADGVYEPLLHLVRNAVDHGIESPEDRKAAGKAGRGSIRIEAEASGSRIRIRIIDDGRGLNADAIRKTAIERGLADVLPSLSEPQLLRLIFQPGFSTAGTVSELSGRGVGLDVVQTMVTRIGGEVHLTSQREVGTCFELVLPTTLALVSTLVVRSAGAPFCVAVNHISEVGFISSESIRSSGTGAEVPWRDRNLPYVALRDLLDQTIIPAPERQHLIIARVSESQVFAGPGQGICDADGEELVAVGVDGWDGHREILVRGLGRKADRWPGISGATELPDGQVAIVVDLPRLLSAALAP